MYPVSKTSDNKQTEAAASTEQASTSVESKEEENLKIKLSLLPLMNQ
ncbi:unnamed protein product, partial [Rotaria magnacalcarata]